MKKILQFPTEGNVLPHMHGAVDESARAAVASQKALISGAQTVGHLVGAVSGTVKTIILVGKAGVGMAGNVVRGVKWRTGKALKKKKKSPHSTGGQEEMPLTA